MNITLTKQKMIRKKVLIYIPSYQKAVNLKKEIYLLIQKLSIDSLSKEEKYLYDNYRELITTSCFSQSCLGIVFFGYSGFKDPSICSKELPYYNKYCYCSEYNKEEVFRLAHREIEGYADFSDIAGGIPNVFQSLEDIKKAYPNEYIELGKLSEEFITNLVEAEKTMALLDKILNNPELGLRDIKRVFPKLYNLIKEVVG